MIMDCWMGGLRYHCRRAWRQKRLLMQRGLVGIFFFYCFPPFCFYFPYIREEKKKEYLWTYTSEWFFFLLALNNINTTTHQQVLSCGSIHKTRLRALPFTLLRSRGSRSIFLFPVHQHLTEHQAAPCGCSQITKVWTSQHHVPNLSSGPSLTPRIPPLLFWSILIHLWVFIKQRLLVDHRKHQWSFHYISLLDSEWTASQKCPFVSVDSNMSLSKEFRHKQVPCSPLKAMRSPQLWNVIHFPPRF